MYLSTFLGNHDVCYSDHLETPSHEDLMQCPPVVTDLVCTAQWQSGLKPFNYLPPAPSTPMGCVAFADRQVEKGQIETLNVQSYCIQLQTATCSSALPAPPMRAHGVTASNLTIRHGAGIPLAMQHKLRWLHNGRSEGEATCAS